MRFFTKTVPVAAMAAVALSAVALSQAAAQSTVTFAAWGGATQAAEVEELLRGSDGLGIQIQNELSGGWTGINTYLQSGAKGWDLISVGISRCEASAQKGYLYPIDYKVVDASKVQDGLAQPDYVGVFTFSYGIAFQGSTYGKDGPQSWADFWDVEKFPGRRTLPAHGLYTLEAALMADGVPMDQVYALLKTKEGLERAFAKVNEIRPNIDVWWQSTGQLTELVRSGEVDLALFPNGRAALLVKDGVDIGFTWNQAITDTECFMIPKNAPNPEGAMKLIALAQDAENQARFAGRVGYGPVNPKSFDAGILTPEQSAWLPTAPENFPKQLMADPTWYASADADEAYLRFGRELR